jgi:ABC-type glycerol-3-phosphate transport system substrate-binding protein
MAMSLRRPPTWWTTRRTILRLPVAAIGAALAACGPAGGGPSSSAGASGPATLDVQLNFTSLEQPYLEKHIGAFMQRYPQIKVNWANTPGEEHYSKLTTMVAGGTPPHLSHMTSRWAGQFIRGMAVYTDLTPLARADRFDLKDF